MSETNPDSQAPARWAELEYTSSADDLTQVSVAVRHPAADYKQDRASRSSLYRELSETFLTFLQGLSIWEEMKDSDRTELESFFTTRAVELACDAYDAQYLTLAIDFREFYVWAVMQEFRDIKAGQEGISHQLEEQRRLALAAGETIDVGMTELARAISSDFEANRVSELAKRVSETLKHKYATLVSKPVIEDSYSQEDAAKELNFPPKDRAFVPQAYKIIRYARQVTRLENQKLWNSQTTYNDLGPFLIRYLQSPYSAETPLLILGHPGSGKSLLTEILAANLAYPNFMTIRVQLRDINAELEPQAQIEQQINRDTGRVVNWVDLTSGSVNPPLIIFDGYDELLQASGKVHADYLERVRSFPGTGTLGRPTRSYHNYEPNYVDR